MKKFWSTAKRSGWRTSPTKRSIQIIVAVVVLITVGYVFLPMLLSGLVSGVMVPVTTVQGWFATSDVWLARYVRDRDALGTRISELEAELAKQSGTRATLERLQRENVSLRNVLSMSTSTPIGATVTLRPPEIPYDAIVVDAGTAAGVSVGAPVYAGAKHVIGIVGEAYRSQSVVQLLTAPDATTDVFILGPNVYATARGRGGGTLAVAVPQGITVATGDVVVLPRASGDPVGEVVHVSSIPTEPTQTAYVSLPVPLQSLQWVGIGREPLPARSFTAIHESIQSVVESYTAVSVPAEFQPTFATSTRATSTATTSVGTTNTQ